MLNPPFEREKDLSCEIVQKTFLEFLEKYRRLLNSPLDTS